MTAVVSKVRMEPPELKEYFIGGLRLLASPKDMMSLIMRRKNDLRLDSIFHRFETPRERQKMFDFSWRMLDSQCEYRYKTASAPYFTIYGVRGIGKSEFAMSVMERNRDIFEMIHGVRPIPGFGRNPSDLNSLLSMATSRGVPAVIIGDETESEVGTGKVTEEQSLIVLQETMRVLQHTLMRCANRYSRLKTFSYYCDFVFEVIFSDRINRVNYAIMYDVDEEIGQTDPRIPIGIIDMPLHKNEELRTIYEKSKIDEQTELTLDGGRTSGYESRLEPIVQALVDFCKEHHYEVNRPRDIERFLKFPKHYGFVIPGGIRNDTERNDALQEAYFRMKEGTGEQPNAEPPGGTQPVPAKAPDYSGPTDDLRAAVLKRLVERGCDPQALKALELRVMKRMSEDDVADELDISQSSVNKLFASLDRAELGYAFQDVYDQFLTNQHIEHVSAKDNSPEPDVIVYETQPDGTRGLVRVESLKCYVQRRNSISIPRAKLGKAEISFSKQHNIPLFLVLYDIRHDRLYPGVLDDGRATFGFAT